MLRVVSLGRGEDHEGVLFFLHFFIVPQFYNKHIFIVRNKTYSKRNFKALLL